jgi:hypothetical protein
VNKFFLYLIVLLIPFWSNAQIELKGVVIDAKTKEPLPYVNYIISSTTGGMTDDSGRFEITASAKTDSVIFTYLGYKDEVLKKRFFKKDSIVVRMQLENFMLEEFTVKAPKGKLPKDTVAIRIFRNVVKHKDENRTKSYDSYQYEEYLKTVASLYNVNQRITSRKIFKPFRFILENQDTTADGTKYVPLILKETITDHYHTSDPKHTKAVVKASKISGIEQLRFSELLDVAFDEVEIYDNQAEVNNKTFLLPFADGGLSLYNYYLIDSVKSVDLNKPIDSSKFIHRKRVEYFDKMVFDTIITPTILPDSMVGTLAVNDSSVLDSGFVTYTVNISNRIVQDSLIYTDTIVVRDSIWLYNLAFVPKSKSDLLFNGMATIQDSSFAILKVELGIDRRANLNFVNDFSLVQGFEHVPGKGYFKNFESRSTNIAFTKRKRSKSVRIARYLFRKDIQVDQPVADSVLAKENTVFLKNYRKQTDSFWVVSRHHDLSVPESKVYFLLDSLKRTRFYKGISKTGSLFASGYYKTKTLDYGNLYQLVSFNDLEGVRLRFNIKSNWRISNWVKFNVYGAYGIRDKRFKYGAEVSVRFPDKKQKNHGITLSFKDDYQRFTLNGRGMDYDYIYTSLLRRRAIADLVYLKDAKFSYFRQWMPNLTTTVNFNYKIYQTIPGRIEFIKTSELGIKDTLRNFKVFSPGLSIVYTPGAKFLQTGNRDIFLKGKLPRFTFNYTFSAKKMGSDFNYQKLDLMIEERLPSPIGHTIIQLTGTKLFGAAPYPLLTIHPGNQSFLYDFKRFTNMLETEFIADQQLSLYIEHHFDGFFFNKIPGWKRLGLREVFITKMALSSLDKNRVSFSDLPDGLEGLNGFYAEVGFGIENIAKLIRVDFSWRLTQLDRPEVRKFRWTLSFSPSF